MKTSSIKFRKGVSASRKKMITDRCQILVKKRKNKFQKLFGPVLQLSKQVNKELKPLITSQDIKKVAALRKQTRHEISRSLLRNTDPAVNDVEKAKSTRNKFKSAFRKTLTNYSAILAIKNKFNRDSGKLLGDVRSAFSILDDIVIADLHELEIDRKPLGAIFKPPFEFGEIDDIFTGAAKTSVPVLDLQSGFISYRFFMEHEATTWFNDPRGIVAYVGVGVTFTMPATGVLKVILTMQSTLARLDARIEDNFGFSDGDVSIHAGVYLNILHPNNVAINELMMTNLNLSSDGDDVHSSINDLPSSVPYVIALTSTGAFAVGETLQIIAGTVVRNASRLDDMTSELSATVSWQVKKLMVQVI